jgi:Ser/Thr protein kinase RdoA (MazF antagonist)
MSNHDDALRGDTAPPGSAPPSAPYSGLTPDAVLDAVESTGLRCTGTLLALNSYENRVFQIGVEDAAGAAGFVVAKFYRPGRWSDAQILEEHAFVAELAAAEVPAVPPLVLAGRTLHHAGGFRMALFARRGGRAPELGDRKVREWLGRFIGRIHAVGRARPFEHRPAIDLERLGAEPSRHLLEHDWLPPELRASYEAVVAQALEAAAGCFARAGHVAMIRLHGDVHGGNVLWTDTGAAPGPHFVDFDDSAMGPAVQDLWVLLSGSRAEMQEQLGDLLAGYEDFAEFDRRELHLIEALRTLRLIHYSAWIARRWTDPAFPAAFPWFDTPRWWEQKILELREQVAAMSEPALVV